MALWYPGYWARFDPVRIYDAAGRQVWSEIDPPREIGAWSGPHLERIPQQCRTSDNEHVTFVGPFWE